MAVPANKTTSTNFAEALVAERIALFLKHYGLPDPIARDLAWVEPGTLGSPVRFVRFEETDTSALAAKTQGADATSYAIDLAEASAIPQIVMFEWAPNDEALLGSDPDLGVEEESIVHAVRALRNKRDRDLMAVSAQTTSIVGTDTAVFNLAAAYAARAAWKALEQGPGAQMVLGHAAAADIIAEIGQTTAVAQTASEVANATATYIGPVAGFPTWESGNVADNGTGGSSNFITVPGRQRSGIGMAESRDIYMKMSRDSQNERDASTSFFFRCEYGVTLTDNRALLEVVTR